MTFEKYLDFFMGKFDLGNMDQTVWNTLHGRIFVLTNPDGTNIVSRLSIHADFILIFLAPLYALWQDPRMLLFIQTVVLGLGAIFVYKLSELVVKNKTLSLFLALSYLLNPMVQKQNLYDFHAVTLATTFLMGAFYFMQKKRYRLFLLMLFLSVITKEDVFLVAAIFGLFLFITQKKWAWLILFITSIAVFYFVVSKIIPFERGAMHFALSYYQDFGDSPSQIAMNMVFKPQKTFSYLFTPDNLSYILTIFSSVGFLSFIAPVYLVFLLPDLAINLLSNNPNMKSIYFQYLAAIIPFVYISAVYGVKNILSVFKNRITVPVLTYYILAATLVASFTLGSLPGDQGTSLSVFTSRLSYREDIERVLERIPPNLSISASNNLGSHLSHRQKLYVLPNGISDADVVMFLLTDIYAQPSLDQQRKLAQDFEKNPKYIVIYKKQDFVAFLKKGVPCPTCFVQE